MDYLLNFKNAPRKPNRTALGCTFVGLSPFVRCRRLVEQSQRMGLWSVGSWRKWEACNSLSEFPVSAAMGMRVYVCVACVFPTEFSPQRSAYTQDQTYAPLVLRLLKDTITKNSTMRSER